MKRWLICLLAPIMISPDVFAGKAAHRCFQVHQLNPESEHHSCAVADLNEDGRKDIIAGGWWYEGPNWQRHYVRDVEKIRGRFDDYSHLPLDVNADGAIDFVSVNYRSESLYWIQHPGPQHLHNGPWQTQLIARPGAMETGRLFDIDNDGHLDVLPNGVQRATWWSLESGQSPVWTEHALPEELAAHGIGCGDINGDGRADVVGRYGWAEAPEDRRNARWVFHREFDLGRDAGIPILVLDVDSDGDSDLIWGRGHRTGLYWLEQTTADSDRQWVRHAIDTEWTQATACSPVTSMQTVVLM